MILKKRNKGKVLVTGGTGYIGSHTVVELQLAGYEVVIIDNLSNSFDFIVNNITTITDEKPDFHRIDLCDKKTLEKFFDEVNEIDGVIHFAAFKAVGESVENPNKYYYNNLTSLINLLENMVRKGIDPIIFSSSCTVYGEPSKVPITEDFPVVEALSPYGNTKQISEEIIADNVKVTDLNAIILRYFNPIGAHESGLLGELPLNIPNSLMPVITQTAIGKREIMTVHGNDYPTPDGTAIRDYFHVSDLARAHVMAMDYLLKKNNSSNYEIFNLGSEKGYSVLEVIKEFIKVSSAELNYEIGPRRAGDAIKVYADSKKAFKKFGWKTEKNLTEMVKTAWVWEQYLKKISF
jgi:UDP-glucose 4-epimerase